MFVSTSVLLPLIVVLLATVYAVYAVPAEAGSAANDITLNVFAIFPPYPNAIARAVAPLSVYVLMSVIATCFMPTSASFKTILSASTKVVELADVPASIIFNSAAVASTAANLVKSACTNPETPSNKFNSAAVEVTFVPPMSKVVTDISPSTVTIQ